MEVFARWYYLIILVLWVVAGYMMRQRQLSRVLFGANLFLFICYVWLKVYPEMKHQNFNLGIGIEHFLVQMGWSFGTLILGVVFYAYNDRIKREEHDE